MFFRRQVRCPYCGCFTLRLCCGGLASRLAQIVSLRQFQCEFCNNSFWRYRRATHVPPPIRPNPAARPVSAFAVAPAPRATDAAPIGRPAEVPDLAAIPSLTAAWVPVEQRASRRVAPLGGVRVECRAGESESDPDLAAGVLDISGGGARLVVRTLLRADQPVCLTIRATINGVAVRRPARVVWCQSAVNGTFTAGFAFDLPASNEDIVHVAEGRAGPPDLPAAAALTPNGVG